MSQRIVYPRCKLRFKTTLTQCKELDIQQQLSSLLTWRIRSSFGKFPARRTRLSLCKSTVSTNTYINVMNVLLRQITNALLSYCCLCMRCDIWLDINEMRSMVGNEYRCRNNLLLIKIRS